MGSGLWGRLTLRWQAAVAVLLPCVAVALFSSWVYPRRLNEQAEGALKDQSVAMGSMVGTLVAPSLGLYRGGIAPLDELDRVFGGLGALHAGLLWVGPEGRVTADAASLARATSNFPMGETFLVPEKGCYTESGETLTMRCRVVDPKDPTTQALFVADFDLSHLRGRQRENQLLGWWSLVAAGGVGLVLAFLFSRALAGPVALVTQAAREVASGDVTVEAVEVEAAGEIKSMAKSFNEMLASLRNLVGQMVSLTGRLASASSGLIGASSDQDRITGQQAAYAQQIAATFEELSRTAEQISASTEVVEQAARDTNEAVNQAKGMFSQVVAGISEIRGESKQVAEAMAKLNADLQQVSKIAQVINSVAERSDLLALNAALEGTKAGEVGRGFSLVAAEMRKLAENVAGSARDIGRIVEKVQESGNEAVAQARIGVDASDRGVKLADEAASVFERIVEMARGTTEAARQIAIATRQQRQSSEQAVQGARNVADLVKQGVDATGRTTKIAQDLQSVAQALNDVTGKFKVMRS